MYDKIHYNIKKLKKKKKKNKKPKKKKIAIEATSFPTWVTIHALPQTLYILREGLRK